MAPFPRCDPVFLVEPMQAELAELRLALAAPGPLSIGGRALAVQHVQAVASALGNLRQTLRRRPDEEASHV